MMKYQLTKLLDDLTRNCRCCSCVCSSCWEGVGLRPGWGVTRSPDSSSPGVFSHLDGASSNTTHGVSPATWPGQGQAFSLLVYIYRTGMQDDTCTSWTGPGWTFLVRWQADKMMLYLCAGDASMSVVWRVFEVSRIHRKVVIFNDCSASVVPGGAKSLFFNTKKINCPLIMINLGRKKIAERKRMWQ